MSLIPDLKDLIKWLSEAILGGPITSVPAWKALLVLFMVAAGITGYVRFIDSVETKFVVRRKFLWILGIVSMVVILTVLISGIFMEFS